MIIIIVDVCLYSFVSNAQQKKSPIVQQPRNFRFHSDISAAAATKNKFHFERRRKANSINDYADDATERDTDIRMNDKKRDMFAKLKLTLVFAFFFFARDEMTRRRIRKSERLK